MGVYAIVDESLSVVNLICADENFAERIGALPAYAGLSVGATYVMPDLKIPAEKREDAYNQEAVIEWDGERLTVTAAAQLWQYYAAEGNGKAAELQVLIVAAKQAIRERYPDKEVFAE